MSREHELLERILNRLDDLEIRMSANDDALAQLTTDVSANTIATNSAVAALGSVGSADDISAGVLAQASQVAANTASLQTALTPGAPSPSPVPVTDTPEPAAAPLSPTEQAIANEAAANEAATPPADSPPTA